MDKKTNRMKELVYKLNEASKAYYQENREIMSNFEYDKLYDELLELERNGHRSFKQPYNKSWI